MRIVGSTLVILLAGLSGLAYAQTYRTDIPPAITTPDSVETRLGTLKFRDGFPDDATVQKVYDNLDFQRGVGDPSTRSIRWTSRS